MTASWSWRRRARLPRTPKGWCSRSLARAAAVLLLGAAAGRAWGWFDWAQAKSFQERQAALASSRRAAFDLVASWPEGPQLLAQRLIEDYGPPDEELPCELSWKPRDPFSRLAVYCDGGSRARPDMMLAAVRYEAPPERWDALKAFGSGVFYDAQAGELVSRADGEEEAFLALNLADEVVRGRRGPDQARANHDLTLELWYSGKGSRYMRGLLFSPARPARPGRRRFIAWPF